MSFTIDQKYYKQKQSLFIGAPTSPYFPKIYIQRVEENHVYPMLTAYGTEKLMIHLQYDQMILKRHCKS